MSYASVEQLRAYLPQVASGSANDVLLQAVLDRATEIVDLELAFSFAGYGTKAAKDVRAEGGEYLNLPGHKAASVTTVYAVSSKGASYESTSEITDFEELEDGRLYYCTGWTQGGWYRVTAEYGYGTVPEAIVEVTLQVAINIWRSRDATGTTIGPDGQGQVSVNRALTWNQRSIIDRVRGTYLGVVCA